MRPGYSTITPTMVHCLARSVLEAALGFGNHKRSVSLHPTPRPAPAGRGHHRTLFAIATRYFASHTKPPDKPLHRTSPPSTSLTARLVDALHAVAAFSRRDRRRAWTCAIDLHYVPYYGSRDTPGIVGGPKKAGHLRSSTATPPCPDPPAEALRRRIVGVSRRDSSPTSRSDPAGPDSPYAGCALAAWFWMRVSTAARRSCCCKSMKLSYAIPLRRRATGPIAAMRVLPSPAVRSQTMEWTTEKSRKSVSTRVLVWQRPGESRAKVYAFRGWGWQRRYRRRSVRGWAVGGIGSASGSRPVTARRTEARVDDECECGVPFAVGRRGVGVAQVWVYLTQQIARDRGLRPSAWVSELPLVEMLDWLVDGIRLRRPARPTDHPDQYDTCDQQQALKLLARERLVNERSAFFPRTVLNRPATGRGGTTRPSRCRG